MPKTKSDNSVKALTEDERLEYSEIGNFYRHDDAVAYQLAAVILPISFGSLAVAAQIPNIAYPLSVFSILLYIFWVAFSERLAWFSNVRKKRLLELEAKAGLRHHRLVSAPPSDLSSQIGARISMRRLRILYLFILIVSWVYLLLDVAG